MPQDYRETDAATAQELNAAIPGARFDWASETGPSFRARYRHLTLDGIMLSQLDLAQPSYVTLGERQPDFNVWHALGPASTANGRVTRADELMLVRPGEGATLRTQGLTSAQSFALQPSLSTQVLELDLPFGPWPVSRAGRWQFTSGQLGQRFLARHQSIMEQVAARPALLAAPATRTALHNAVLEAIAGLGHTGAFRPDRAATGRHTRIMLRFEQIVREGAGEPMGMAEICRQAGASRRALTAIVLARTGRSPWDYLRWRRLWQAHERLAHPAPGATVTDVAYSLGFWHLGRFAAAYAATFGERPSLTLARAGGAAPARFAQSG